jgi:hypothetical protein
MDTMSVAICSRAPASSVSREAIIGEGGPGRLLSSLQRRVTAR